MDQSSSSVFAPSLPSLMVSPFYPLRMDFSWEDDVVSQGVVAASNNGDDNFEFSYPLSEWDEPPSSPTLIFNPDASHLSLPSVIPTTFFKPPAPPPLLPPPLQRKPYHTSVANLPNQEDCSPDFKRSCSADSTLEDLYPINKKAKAMQEKLPKAKKCKLKDRLSRSGTDYKRPRSPSSPFESGKKGMNDTALGIMGIKAYPSFLNSTPLILKSSSPSPTRKSTSATSSPSWLDAFSKLKLEHQKKTSLLYRQGFLGCLGFSSKFDPPVRELSVA